MQQEGKAVELDFLTAVPNSEVLARMAAADIVADQFISGYFGQTTIEAMALGKPVLCYVRDIKRVADPNSFPIINANPDSLYEVLKGVFAAPEKLVDIGRKSREYVVSHHSIPAFAIRLADLYRKTAKLPLRQRLALYRKKERQRAKLRALVRQVR